SFRGTELKGCSSRMEVLAPHLGHSLEQLRACQIDQPFLKAGLCVKLRGERRNLLRREVDQQALGDDDRTRGAGGELREKFLSLLHVRQVGGDRFVAANRLFGLKHLRLEVEDSGEV